MIAQQEVTVRSSKGWQNLPVSWPVPIRKILAARGIMDEQQLNYALADLPRPNQLLGMECASALLVEALTSNWRIMIVADFDTDGATSCAVAIRGLRAMGAKDLNYIVPNRFIHGYGLTPALLEEIPEDKQPDLLITVDNGIASIAGVEVAQRRGMKVLITDHHLPGEKLPTAEAILNPNQRGDNFPSKNLAGVGVCFYMLLGLRQALRKIKWFDRAGLDEPNLMILMDLVALGTVADVVKLDQLNRTLVSLGLARIRSGRCSTGLEALIKISGRDTSILSSADMGFSIAPRLNAAGRLEDMGLGIEVLLADDFSQAFTMAKELDDINLQRREVEQAMQEDALSMLEAMTFDAADAPLAYCLYDDRWHQGVVGLLASRIKDRQHRPVIVFAPGKAGEIKGSARSIPGVHIRDVLALVASRAPEILTHFGGHAMAAGVTISFTKLAEFEQHFLNAVEQTISEEDLNKELLSDGELTCSETTLALAEQLPMIAPWGQGFPEPLFHGTFVVDNIRTVGQQNNHLRLTLRLSDDRKLVAMAFGKICPDWLVVGCQVSLRYRLNVNEYREERQLQFLIEDLFQV